MIKLAREERERPAVVVEIGNTTTTVGLWIRDEVQTPLIVPTGDEPAFHGAFDAHLATTPGGRIAATVVASVVPRALEAVRTFVFERTGKEALVVGDGLPLPMDIGVQDPKAIGVDRVCQAFAAFERLATECTVVAFGTAITVDLVDGDGILVGGAIMPGVRVQLRALHQNTAQLPEIAPAFPTLPFGQNTAEAIQNGVCRGVIGAVRNLVEGYATHLNRWPQVVATGGDAAFLQPHLDFIDTFVANLALRGVGLAFSKHLADEGA